MVERLKKYDRLNTAVLLVAMGILCFLLLPFSFFYSGQKAFLFLSWSILLAFLPWLLTTIVRLYPRLRRAENDELETKEKQ